MITFACWRRNNVARPWRGEPRPRPLNWWVLLALLFLSAAYPPHRAWARLAPPVAVPTLNAPTINGAATFKGTASFTNATTSALFTGGPVGIGMSPVDPLDITSSAASPTFRVQNSNTGWGSAFVLDGTSAGGIGFMFDATGSANGAVHGGAFSIQDDNGNPGFPYIDAVIWPNGGFSVPMRSTAPSALSGAQAFAVGASNQFQVSSVGDATARRVVSSGSALVVGDVALGAGWGPGATKTVVGSDGACTITVTTSAADTPTANPTLTLTWHDGAWTAAPFTVACMDGGGTGAVNLVTTQDTTTTTIVTYRGTPAALSVLSYKFTLVTRG